MTYEEYKKKRQERDSSSTFTAYERYKYNQKAPSAKSVLDDLNARVENWFNNNNTFMSDYKSRIEGRTGGYGDAYVNDAKSAFDLATNQKQTFDKELQDILSIAEEYKDFLSLDYRTMLSDSFRKAQKAQDDILKGYSADVDYWSQWKDENAYKEWVDVQKQNEEWAAVNIEGERSWYNRDMQNLAQAKEWQDKLDYDRELRMYYPNDYHNLPNTLSDADIRNANAQIMRLTLGKGIDEFEKYLSDKNVYLTQAERYQKSVELASVADAPDFEYYAGKGAESDENTIAYLRNNPTEIESVELSPNKSKNGNNEKVGDAFDRISRLSNIEYAAAANMTDEEFKVYSYYFERDKKKAKEYLESIEESLNLREALDIKAGVGDNDFAKIIFGAVAGLDSFRSGVSALLENDDYYAPSAVQMAGQQFREDLGESNVKLPDWLGGASVGQATYDLLNTGANMAPSILASIGANLLLPGSGAVVGGTLMGASAGGNAYAEMINAGYTKEQAKTYGKLVAASESLLQYALGGVSALGGKLTGGAITNMLSKIDKAYIRVGLSTIGKMASEGLEEGLQSVLEPWFKSVATNTDFEAADIDEVLYSGLLGALSAGFLDNVNIKDSNTVVGGTANLISNVANKYKSNVAVGKQISGVDGALDRLLELGSVQSADSVAYKVAEKINKRLADGKKVGAYTIAKLFNAEGAALTDANVADITKSLTRKGVTESDAKTISAWMAKAVEGVPLTEAQANALENNPLLDRTFQDVIINPNSTVYQRTKQMSDFASDVSRGEMTQNKATTATPATDTAKAVDTTESATTEEDATESKFKASVDGKTVLTETAEEVKPVGIESIKNGSVKVKLEDGKVVDASELSFATKDEAVLYETISNITDITPKSATYLIKNFKPVEGVPTEVLASDLALAYQYGKINYVDGLENLDSSKSQMKAAFYIGRNEAEAALGEKSLENAETVLKTDKKSGIINKNELEIENENREGIYLRDGSERFGSTSTRGQIRGVEESTGQEESGGIESRFTADSEAARLVDEAREIKVSSLGIPRGSSNHTVKLVDKANETSSMKEARKLAEERGLKATFFVGDNLTINGKDGSPISARAYIRGKNVFVRADHYAYTSVQLMRHEIGHDMVAKGEVDIDAVRQRLVQTAGEENIDEVSTLYTNAYDGTGMTAEEIWEECICDSLGDMNIFAEVEMLGEFLDEMLPEIKGATQNSESPTQTRGSPEGKASRETRTYSKEDYNNFGWVRQNNVINAGYWKAFTENFAQAVSGNQYFPKTKNGEYMIEVYDMYDLSDVADVIVFAKGTIESPNVTKIIKIDLTQDIDIEAKRSELYAAERKGIRRSFGQVFIQYNKSDFLSERKHEGNSFEGDGNNNRLNTKRSRSEIKANPITQFHVNEDENTVTYTYANGETITESLSKTSRELDFIEYANEMSDVKQARLAGRMAQGRIDAEVIRKKDEQIKSIREQRDIKLKELQQKYAESRKNAVEGRHKTEERHAIAKIAKDLDKLLNHGTKERNVKKGASDLVRSALDLANMYFASDDDIITSGIATQMTDAETKLIEKYTALYDEYHSYDDSVTANKVKRADLRSKMNAIRSELSDVLEREKKRINDTTASGIYDTLVKEYKKLSGAEESYLREAFDKDVVEYIEEMRKKVGNNLIGDMTLEQLKDLHRAFTMIKTVVQKSNKLFGEKNRATIAEQGESAMAEIEKQGHKATFTHTGKLASTMSFNNLKPIYLIERTKSKVLQERMQEILDGESIWAVDMEEGRTFLDEAKKKHGYDKWDFDKAYEFETETGLKYSLTLGEIFSIYAYSKRGEQALNHLRVDGFVFDKTKKIKNGKGFEVELNDSTSYAIDDKTRLSILGKLTAEQRAFIDETQKYLSEVMGEKGNEVSREMYGIDLFGEENYFPLRAEGAYLERAREQANGQVKYKNRGFTKATQEGARNSVVLSDYSKVWAEHVAEMSGYHAFTLALENFYKVYNYQNKSSTETNKKGVIPALNNAYGDGITKAIDQLLADLNGGARSDPRESPFKSGLSLFKKAKTMFSLSVIIQQPSALLRAQAMIDAKYFVGFSKGKHKEMWNEIKKYAPVAVIKEMGRFDVGMGSSSAEWLLNDKNWREAVDDFLSRGASYADEAAWIKIWNAVKRETLHTEPTLKPNSEEFLKKAGQRFEDIIRHTQVYDSTLSRSGNMRSKSGLMQIVTAFLAEPTTAINMREMALRSGDKNRVIKTTVAVYASTLLNAVLVALPYAMRDDDEDETFIEKYATALTTSFVDSINPLTSLPFIKDIYSMLQGYDVKRSDMALADDLINSFEKFTSAVMDEEKDKKKITDSLLSLVGDLSSFTGLPVDNAIREVKSIVNFAKTLTKDFSDRDTTWLSLGDALQNAFTKETPIVNWIFDEETKADKLYDAIMAGDKAYADRIKGTYKTETSLETAMRKALREHDPRIKEAAEARIGGNIAEYTRIVKEITAEGKFVQDIVVGAINTEINAINKATKEEPEEVEVDEATSIYRADDINAALESGDTDLAKEVITELVSVKSSNNFNKSKAEAEKEGKRFDERKEREEAEKSARSSVKSAITKHWKKLYKEAYAAKDTAEMRRIREILYATRLYGSASEVVETVSGWLKEE